mmetsp:Transcript_1949/g.5799  ORF Transcript_1949/g.5799 Transcript_1949/m.5799 type:complete len:203 (+) Transcript_1949:305-913(+)
MTSFRSSGGSEASVSGSTSPPLGRMSTPPSSSASPEPSESALYSTDGTAIPLAAASSSSLSHSTSSSLSSSCVRSTAKGGTSGTLGSAAAVAPEPFGSEEPPFSSRAPFAVPFTLCLGVRLLTVLGFGCGALKPGTKLVSAAAPPDLFLCSARACFSRAKSNRCAAFVTFCSLRSRAARRFSIVRRLSMGAAPSKTITGLMR